MPRARAVSLAQRSTPGAPPERTTMSAGSDLMNRWTRPRSANSREPTTATQGPAGSTAVYLRPMPASLLPRTLISTSLAISLTFAPAEVDELAKEVEMSVLGGCGLAGAGDGNDGRCASRAWLSSPNQPGSPRARPV